MHFRWADLLTAPLSLKRVYQVGHFRFYHGGRFRFSQVTKRWANSWCTHFVSKLTVGVLIVVNYQGMYQNDFLGLTFSSFILNGKSTGAPISGEYVVEQLYQIETSRSKWEDLAVVFGMVIGYRVIFFVMIKFSENFGPKLRSKFINPLVAYFTSRSPAVKNTIRPLSIHQQSPAHDTVPLRYQQIAMPSEFRKIYPGTVTPYTAWLIFKLSFHHIYTVSPSRDLLLTVNAKKLSVAGGVKTAVHG